MTLIDWIFFSFFFFLSIYHTVHTCKQFMMQLCGIQCCFIFVTQIFDPAELQGGMLYFQ